MNIKQVIILRKDLNMRKGKMVAQGAHASLKAFTEASSDIYAPNLLAKTWFKELSTKICVSVNSEVELLEIYQKAKDAGLPCALIKDAGLTEFKEPTYTAVAIGPALAEMIDPITAALSLL